MLACATIYLLYGLIAFLLSGTITGQTFYNGNKLTWDQAKQSCAKEEGTLLDLDVKKCTNYHHFNLSDVLKGVGLTEERDMWIGLYVLYESITSESEEQEFLKTEHLDPLEWQCGKLYVTNTIIMDWTKNIYGDNCSKLLPSICNVSVSVKGQQLGFIDARENCNGHRLWSPVNNIPLDNVVQGKEYWVGKTYRVKWCSASQNEGTEEGYRQCVALSSNGDNLALTDCNQKFPSLCRIDEKPPTTLSESTTTLGEPTIVSKSTTLNEIPSANSVSIKDAFQTTTVEISRKGATMKERPPSSDNSLQGGLITGIAIGVLAVIAIIIMVVLLVRRQILKKKKCPPTAQNNGISQSKLQDSIELDCANTHRRTESQDADTEYNYIAKIDSPCNQKDNLYHYSMTRAQTENGPSSLSSPYDHINNSDGVQSAKDNGYDPYDHIGNAKKAAMHQTKEDLCSQTGDNVYNTTQHGNESTYDHTGHVEEFATSADNTYDSTQNGFSENVYDSTVQRERENALIFVINT